MAKRGYTGAVANMYGAVEHALTVVSIEDVTAHYRRITFDAPTMFDGDPMKPAEWIRLWAPDAVRPGREHMRGYTVVDPDPEQSRFSVEFVLHEPAGPACTWASNVEVGATIPALRWASTHFTVPDPAPAGYLLLGDAASIPGINGILSTVPDTARVEILLEQHHELDPQIPIAQHPHCTVAWVEPCALAHAIDERDWSNWFAWVTGEAETAKQLRARLKALGFPKADMHGRAYWTRSKAMGTDREKVIAAPSTTGKWLAFWRFIAGFGARTRA